jgi:hypothetical protein
MGLTYKKRMEQTEAEIQAAYPRHKKMGDINPTDAEFWHDKNDTLFNGACFKLLRGTLPVNKWINDNGFIKCKKTEATSLLIVGEKIDGCFIIGKHKNYWLKPV